MATVDKNFKIKNGLVVEGTTATVNGSNVFTAANTTDDITEGSTKLFFTDERAQDAFGALLAGGTQTNISVTYDDENGTLSFVAENGVDDSTTDDLDEGPNNLYFTDQRALDATAAAYDTIGAAATAEANANAYTDQEIAALVDSAPETLDTLNELAAALGDDANFATTVTNEIATKVAKAGDTMTGELKLPSLNINDIAKKVATSGLLETAGQIVANTFAKATHRSAEYIVKVSTGTHSEVSKVLITLDSSDNVAITEYGIVSTSGTALGSVTADVSGTDVRLLVTTANNNSTVTVSGTLLI
jgi:predicted SpoU family rRNA methylase